MHPGSRAALEKLRGGPASGGIDVRAFAARSPFSAVRAVQADNVMELGPRGRTSVDPWPANISNDKLAVRIDEATADLQKNFGGPPDFVVLLGSNMGDAAEGMFVRDGVDHSKIVPYSKIRHFPVPTTVGHAGQLVVGKLENGLKIAFLCGRTHGYEYADGTSNRAVTFSTRVMTRWGVRNMIATSAVGAINEDYQVGQIVVVRDHVAFAMRGHPLMGRNLEMSLAMKDSKGKQIGIGMAFGLGERFPDLPGYHPVMREIAQRAAQKIPELGTLAEGIFGITSGPTYETPAEIRVLKGWGCDVAGMSMAPEAIVARHGQVRFLGLAVISNAAAKEGVKLTHTEVGEAMQAAKGKLFNFLKVFFDELVQSETFTVSYR